MLLSVVALEVKGQDLIHPLIEQTKIHHFVNLHQNLTSIF